MAQVDPLLLQKPTSSFLRGGITFAITRPVAILMLTLAVVVFGYVSYFRLPLNLMPDISYPSITVRTEYAGAPSDVEELISKPVEQALGVINNLVHISSISRADVSDVLLEFAWGTDMDEVYQSIREKLGTLFLPKEAQKPLLLRYDPSLDPILRIALYGGKSEFERRWITEQEIKRKIESLPGVAAIKIKGGLEKEIIVDIDHHLLEKYKMDIGQILKRLREENINMASGRIQEAETEYLVRSINQFKSVEEIQNLVIAKREEQKIHIRDLATVSWSHKEREVITRINGKDSVEISIYKEGDANLVQVAERVKRALFGTIHPPSSPKKDLPPTTSQESPTSVSSATEEKTKESESTISTEEEKQGVVQHKETLIPLSQQLPAGMKLEILSDQSIFIKNAINEVRDTALMGAFLAIVILLFFLKKFSVTLIIGISIPISIIATFAPMYIYKVSLNIMSLGGLALGAGMLVDNSIVVLEAIFRRRERGENFFDSALYGTEEVAGAVIASTLTTVCVFFPIVFVEGIAGQVFKDQALSVVFSLLASLVVAIFLIPMLTTRQLSAQQVQGFQWFSFHSGKELKQWWKNWSWLRWCLLFLLIFPRFLLFLGVELLGKLLLLVLVLLVLGIKYFSKLVLLLLKPFLFPLFFIGDSSLNLIHRFYTVTLRWILHHQLSIVLPILGLFLYSLYVSQFLGRELIPKVNQGEFTVELFLPVGTPLQKTNRVLEPLENQAIAYEEIELLSSTIGVQKEAILSSDEGEHTAKLLVRLRPQDLKKEESFTESLYKTFRSEPEIQEIKVSYPSLFSIKTPIEIEIRGYNLQILKQLAEEVVTIFQEIPGFYNIRSTIKRGNPELQIQYKRDLLAAYQLNIEDISLRIKNFMGEVATKYVVQEEHIDVFVRLEHLNDVSVEELENLVITPANTYPKRLKEVAHIERLEGFSEIRRINQQRAALISASLSQVDLSKAVDELKEKLRERRIPRDFQFLISGQSQEMEVSLQSLKFALALAIFLVYVVLACQFESLLHPFIIIVSIPLALMGVIFTLAFLQIPLSIIVYIGIILLVGIVVNNAIVLIDCINQLLDKGVPLIEAVVTAGDLRLRPILMTTLTTILGLLPMTGFIALGSGEGEEIRAPMAITVISGLSSSTLLTLFVIPLLYTVVEQFKIFLGLGRIPPPSPSSP